MGEERGAGGLSRAGRARLPLIAAGVLLASCLLAWLAPAMAQQVPSRFSLVTQDGRPLDESALRGRPYVLFFGFTSCPEVCPTALYELSQVLAELGPEADRLKVLFVTVDPARDTPDQLASYLGAFDPRITGLHGSEEATAAAAAAFKATYRRVPQPDGSYTMEHTAVLFLVDGEGRIADAIDYRAPHAAQLARLRRLLGTS
ncbi:SCO family protein [Ancylobacter oerskovii]|uniref:SCO family protein n=1 Tax=Ancylobacter oerskovii TaxID=459519 RepID=A0ABW4YVI1_9HYPH|nr:SCO family protein [Ancylobacter oerskovii]MBS7544268.1 SCO family protein [Ancylobacter oerskovii]